MTSVASCRSYFGGVLWCAEAWSYREGEEPPESLVPILGLFHLLDPDPQNPIKSSGEFTPDALNTLSIELATKLPMLLPNIYRFWHTEPPNLSAKWYKA